MLQLSIPIQPTLKVRLQLYEAKFSEDEDIVLFRNADKEMINSDKDITTNISNFINFQN